MALVDVAAADDKTALAVQQLIAARCAVAPSDRTSREPGEPRVRLRSFLDLRQGPHAWYCRSGRHLTRPDGEPLLEYEATLVNDRS
ncbi:DUF6207 family protein [Streptomyces sp. NPDC048664]|uniref:DUF6207 family protein n=1 Tax=Streptomyces sp. NPDC048664 TaxID=3154505 RepID=UPI00341B08D7